MDTSTGGEDDMSDTKMDNEKFKLMNEVNMEWLRRIYYQRKCEKYEKMGIIDRVFKRWPK